MPVTGFGVHRLDHNVDLANCLLHFVAHSLEALLDACQQIWRTTFEETAIVRSCAVHHLETITLSAKDIFEHLGEERSRVYVGTRRHLRWQYGTKDSL